jgi:hypothetical protein
MEHRDLHGLVLERYRTGSVIDPHAVCARQMLGLRRANPDATDPLYFSRTDARPRARSAVGRA